MGDSQDTPRESPGQRGHFCSDENLPRARDQHEVQRQALQAHLAVLAAPVRRAQERVEQPLEHREKRLDLPALPVELLGPVLMDKIAEEAAASARVGLGARASAFGRDDAEDAELAVQELVVLLAVEAAVGRQRLERLARVRALVPRRGGTADRPASVPCRESCRDRRDSLPPPPPRAWETCAFCGRCGV